jgi:hypothetical protein
LSKKKNRQNSLLIDHENSSLLEKSELKWINGFRGMAILSLIVYLDSSTVSKRQQAPL